MNGPILLSGTMFGHVRALSGLVFAPVYLSSVCGNLPSSADGGGGLREGVRSPSGATDCGDRGRRAVARAGLRVVGGRRGGAAVPLAVPSGHGGARAAGCRRVRPWIR